MANTRQTTKSAKSLTNAMQIPQKILKKRRQKFFDSMETGSAALLLSAEHQHRNSDVEHKFRQDSSFWYLTGFNEADSALLMIKTSKECRSYIFSREKDKLKEIWTGLIEGPESAKEISGVEACFKITDLESQLEKLLGGLNHFYFEFAYHSYSMLRSKILEIAKNRRIHKLTSTQNLIGELRLFKEEFELDLMRKSAAIASKAHKMAMGAVKPKKYEYEIEALIEGYFRSQNAGWAYSSIVATGANATILHYTNNNKELKNGDLLLIDAGSEFNYYASDITRTFPVNGKFTPAQKKLYKIVLDAQEAAIGICEKKNSSFNQVHDAAVKKLTEGLIELGLLKESLDQAIEKATYRKFYMHKTSHWLGLDVHDVGSYVELDKNSKSRVLKPGMVITVEPGLYMSPEDESIPAEYRGIGIRIEDDILITAKGFENLTAGTPKTVRELAAAFEG